METGASGEAEVGDMEHLPLESPTGHTTRRLRPEVSEDFGLPERLWETFQNRRIT